MGDDLLTQKYIDGIGEEYYEGMNGPETKVDSITNTINASYFRSKPYIEARANGAAVTAVTLPSKATLILGDSATMLPTVMPENAVNQEVTWSSANTAVASINSQGVITTNKSGITLIKVTTVDGGFSAVCRLTVTSPLSFKDVPSEEWYAIFVEELASCGIINGKSDNNFDPNAEIKRGEFAKILFAASGENIVPYQNKTSFTDVSVSKWYAPYVEWAQEKGIVNGVGNHLFAPEDNISRQEIVAMIQRYADYKGIVLPKVTEKVSFADDEKIASWAKEAVYSMKQAGIIQGKEKNLFDPKGDAKRCEAAKIISLLLKL